MNGSKYGNAGRSCLFNGTWGRARAFRIGILLIPVLLFFQTTAQAELVETYTARLSENDHYNSKGDRLDSAAAIIRQDRANYHKFNAADPEDTGDSFFDNTENRAALERFLKRGATTQDARKAIVNGTPLIEVRIYQTGPESYVDVEIIESSGPIRKPLKKGTGTIRP